jgi:hypothetical protein
VFPGSGLICSNGVRAVRWCPRAQRSPVGGDGPRGGGAARVLAGAVQLGHWSPPSRRAVITGSVVLAVGCDQPRSGAGPAEQEHCGHRHQQQTGRQQQPDQAVQPGVAG